MAEIDISTVPRLQARFDPLVWPRDNPLHHPAVYSLDRDQLKVWGEEATEVRQSWRRWEEEVT